MTAVTPQCHRSDQNHHSAEIVPKEIKKAERVNRRYFFILALISSLVEDGFAKWVSASSRMQSYAKSASSTVAGSAAGHGLGYCKGLGYWPRARPLATDSATTTEVMLERIEPPWCGP